MQNTQDLGVTMHIKEVIVVEGRDDADRVKRSVDAEVIITHGYGIKEETFRRIEEAQKRCGVIVLTDPDHAGEQIRKRLHDRIPGLKNAYVPRADAKLNGDIGVENASSDVIIKALATLRTEIDAKGAFEMSDLIALGLSGGSEAKNNRIKVGAKLGIGFCNARQLLGRLNHYGITKEELIEALR